MKSSLAVSKSHYIYNLSHFQIAPVTTPFSTSTPSSTTVDEKTVQPMDTTTRLSTMRATSLEPTVSPILDAVSSTTSSENNLNLFLNWINNHFRHSYTSEISTS